MNENRVISNLMFCREISSFTDRTDGTVVGVVYKRPKESFAVNSKFKVGVFKLWRNILVPEPSWAERVTPSKEVLHDSDEALK